MGPVFHHHADGRICQMDPRGPLAFAKCWSTPSPRTFLKPLHLGVHGWVGIELDLPKNCLRRFDE